MVDMWCASYAQEPEAVTLDIDDTLDAVHEPQAQQRWKRRNETPCPRFNHRRPTASGRQSE